MFCVYNFLVKLVNKIVTFSSILIVSLIFDQWTKIMAIQDLKPLRYPLQYFGGFFRLLYAENRGAWGNLAGDWPDTYRSIVLIWLPLAVLIGLAVYIFVYKKMRMIEVLGLSFIISGGVGNLIDRIRYDFVVDMLWMGFSGTKIQTNIFNIADVVIMTGFFLLVYLNIVDYLEKRKQDQQKALS